MVEELIRQFGPDIVITTPQGSWLVPRHYVALHGIKAWELPSLGFPKVSEP